MRADLRTGPSARRVGADERSAAREGNRSAGRTRSAADLRAATDVTGISALDVSALPGGECMKEWLELNTMG